VTQCGQTRQLIVRKIVKEASGAILDEGLDGTLGSRFLYAFWRLCEQKIAAVQPPASATAPR
jgi:hypothetical protein